MDWRLPLLFLLCLSLSAQASPTLQSNELRSTIGFKPYEIDTDRLAAQANCAGGCDECIPEGINPSVIFLGQPCGTSSEYGCASWLEECPYCNGVCNMRLVGKIGPFDYMVTINDDAVNRTITDCNQWRTDTYCNNPNIVKGAYQEMLPIGIDIGSTGSPFDDYYALQQDPHFQSVMSDMEDLPYAESNDERAWRERIGAFAIALDRLPPSLRSSSGYYERAAMLCIKYYIVFYGSLTGMGSPTSYGFWSDSFDPYEVDQLIQIHQATCSDYLDCSVLTVEPTSWGRVKAKYR